MNVTVVGAGAVGLLVSVYMIEAGHNVTLITRTSKQATILMNEGICVERLDGKKDTFYVKAFDITRFNHVQTDCLLIAVKSFDVEHVLNQIKEINTKAILFLQNGMSHLQLLNKLGNMEIGLSIVEHGVMKMDEQTVKHTGAGKMKWALIDHKRLYKTLQTLFSSLETTVLSPFYMNDYKIMVKSKLLVNAVINPLTALFQIKNGELLSNGDYYKLLKVSVEETSSVLGLNRESSLKAVLEICQSTSNNTSSMLQDINRKQQTEIDSILGYVLEEGRRLSIQTPQLLLLYHAIKRLEKTVSEGVE